MLRKILLCAAAGVLAASATADIPREPNKPGEALAWTLAAYASCDNRDVLLQDMIVEIDGFGADTMEALNAMMILQDANGACGTLQAYAVDLVALASRDLTAFEELLKLTDSGPEARFIPQEPEGNDSEETTTILTSGRSTPPPKGSMLEITSDYQR